MARSTLASFILTSSTLTTILSSAFAQGDTQYAAVPPDERLVGIAYQTWFPPIGWDRVWGTPELGHYGSADPSVIRQHAEWLTDAGVDFIWIDWSNNVTHDPSLRDEDPAARDGERSLSFRPDIEAIESATRKLFAVYAQMPVHPRVSIFLGCSVPEAVADGRLQRKADQVYEQFVADPVYSAMLQEYLGKPLLVIYVGTPSPFPTGLPDWDDERFTVRWFTGFVTEQANLRADDLVSRYGYWSWEDRGPQTFAMHEGRPEAMVVTAASRAQAEPGVEAYVPARGRRNGETFRAAWDRACEIGPKFAMVVAWNEWTLDESPSAEISKDIEPSAEFGHVYLDILKAEMARFKGRTAPEGG